LLVRLSRTGARLGYGGSDAFEASVPGASNARVVLAA